MPKIGQKGLCGDIMKLEEAIRNIAEDEEFEGLIEYNREITARNVNECPFLTRLEHQERISTTHILEISREIQKSTARIIAEGEEPPKPKYYERITARMSDFKHPLEIPVLGRSNAEIIEYLKQEVPNGIMEIRKSKEKAIIQGAPSKAFKGLEEIIPKSMRFTVTSENSKTPILDKIMDVIYDIAEITRPTLALSGIKVTGEIFKEMRKEKIYREIEAIPNLEVMTLKPYTGTSIPILPSKHVPANTIYLLNENKLHIKDYFKKPNPEPAKKIPIFYKKLARIKLTKSGCLVHCSTFYTTAPQEHARIDISHPNNMK